MIKASNKQEFFRDLEVLHYAGVGIILCRTREGGRTVNALHDFAYEHNLAFKSWNVRDGWVTVGNDPSNVDRDGTTDPYAAMKMILDVGGSGSSPMPEGVYVMQDLHWVLDKHPGIIRCLKEYVHDFAEREYRLVIIVPDSFTIPADLESEVTLMDFNLPSRDELHTAITSIVDGTFVDEDGNKVDYEAPFDQQGVDIILNAAAGMPQLEAESAVARAIVENEVTWPNTDPNVFAQTLMRVKSEIIRRSEVLELHKTIDPAKLGGMDLLKEWLDERRMAFTQEAADFGVVPPKGILLAGVPGTGKSLAAKIIGWSLGMFLVRVDVSRMFGSLVGQTEGRVRAAIKQLEAMAPCVAWIDEIDKAGIDPRQGGGDSGTSSRVIGQILTAMQESDKKIFWVFTANRVDALPPELLRKGRLDELFNIAPPNSVERGEILDIHLRARRQDPSDVVDLAQAVVESQGYVGAEIEGAVNEAVTKAFCHKVKVTGELIVEQLKMSVPIRVSFADDFQRMKVWADNNARPASTYLEGEDTGGKELGVLKGHRKIRRRKGGKGSFDE
jgi:hypothetical protein